jgi:hypothetical protein
MELLPDASVVSSIGTKTVEPRILVVFSGPTVLNLTGVPPKWGLYINNFDYFIHNGGVDCDNHDTILVVTKEVYLAYEKEIQQFQATHCSAEHFVKLVIREDICYDMESVRLVMEDEVPGVYISNYDYFIYANCGCTGPAPRSKMQSHWTQEFISRFDEKVKLVGVSHNCYKVKDKFRPHIQSIAYALDRKGIELIKKSGAIYDCRKGGKTKGSVIERYEVGMSMYLQNAGYAVRSIMRNTTLSNYSAPCEGGDVWLTGQLKEAYGGRIPSINETIFFKTSRVLPPEIATLINWTDPIRWNW